MVANPTTMHLTEPAHARKEKVQSALVEEPAAEPAWQQVAVEATATAKMQATMLLKRQASAAALASRPWIRQERGWIHSRRELHPRTQLHH